MKTFFAFYKTLIFFDHKGSSTSRSSTGFDSMDSGSTDKTRSTYRDKPPQIIPASWIDGKRLRELLNRKFGSQYRLETVRDEFRIFAAEKLSEEEIQGCRF
ncbi:hypothetical protein F5X98DRAFT_335886 [Xylaria grammica]|nr:hypothetical protein F5X98DRAFT_335886 [Xylaria grammica]